MNSNLAVWLHFILVVFLLSCNSNAEHPSKSAPKEKHYVSFANVEALQKYLRWSPGCAPLVAAHRGGPMSGYPENCIETFDNILYYAACIIECDVTKSKDGVIVLMHDKTLERTTTGNGNVNAFTLAELKNLYLKDPKGDVTSYRIPTFEETLNWAKNRAILEVDVKSPVTPDDIVGMIKKHNAQSYTIVITYSWNTAQDYHFLNRNLMISAPAKGIEGTNRLLKSDIDHRCLVAFVGVSEPPKEVYDLLHENGIRAILGTLGNLDRKIEGKGHRPYIQFLKNGADILATDNAPIVAEAIAEYIKKR